jgi:tetratricopeptide (TPR) repeat protein
LFLPHPLFDGDNADARPYGARPGAPLALTEREVDLALDRDHVQRIAHQLAEQGQYLQAVNEYRKLLAEDPTDTRTLLVTGDLLVRAGEAEGAIQTYDTVARLYAEQGFADKAVAVYRQVRRMLIQLRPDLLARYGHVLEHLLVLYQGLGKPNEALGLLDEEANRLRAASLELEAVAVYRRMAEVSPTTPLSHLRLAEGLCRTGNVDEAIGSFWAAAELLLGAGRREDALRVVERILHFKQDIKYAKAAAELYLAAGQAPEAMQALSRLQICFQADPSDLETLQLLARAFLLIDQEDKAIEVQKELARQAHEQGNREVFQATLTELKRRAPSDDQVQALTQMPPPGPESVKPGKRRTAPKRPGDPSVAAVLSSSIPPQPVADRASAPGRPPRPAARPPGPPRVPPRVPSTPRSSPPERRDPSEAGLDRPAFLAPEPSRPPHSSAAISDAPVSLNSLMPSTSPPPAASAGRTAAGNAPTDPQAYVNKVLSDANTYRDLGLHDRAITLLREALRYDTESIPLRELLRDTLAETGDTAAAIEEMVEIAQVYLAHEREDHAETVLNNILEAAPNHRKATALLREIGKLSKLPSEPLQPSSAPIPLARDASSSRASALPPLPSMPPPRTTAAIPPPAPSKPPEKPLSRLPSGLTARPSLDDVLEQAETLATRGQYDRAEALLLEELSRLPGHPLLLEALEEIRDDQRLASRPPTQNPAASSAGSSGRPSRFSASPGSLLAPTSSGGISLQTQLTELDAAVRESQNPPSGAFSSKVDVELLFEKFKEGVRTQVADSDSATHYDLGLAYKDMNLLDDAIEELTLAARDKARESVCFSTIALIYVEQRMFQKAIDFLNRGLASPNRLPEQDITLHYDLGNVYELSGKFEQALDHFEEVVGRNPSFRDVRDRMARVKQQLRQSAAPSSNDDDVDRAFKSLLGD